MEDEKMNTRGAVCVRDLLIFSSCDCTTAYKLITRTVSVMILPSYHLHRDEKLLVDEFALDIAVKGFDLADSLWMMCPGFNMLDFQLGEQPLKLGDSLPMLKLGPLVS